VDLHIVSPAARDALSKEMRMPTRRAASQLGGDSGESPFEAVDEGVEAGQVVGADPLDPSRELVAPERGEHLPESADVLGEGIRFRAAGEDGLELQVLAPRQGVGVSQDPADDRA